MLRKVLRKKKKIVISLLVVMILTFSITLFKNKNTIYINSVLLSKSYSYLPDEAKDYIRDVYAKTGKVILTEKNKKDNKLYLNPMYVEYLTYTDKQKKEQEVIPVPMVVDYLPIDTVDGSNIPSSYDLRNVSGKNYVTPNRNQGNLGICWAFATAGAAESHLLKTTDTSYSSSSKLFSERQLDYATAVNGITDYDSEYVSFIDRELGDGGNIYLSSIALANGISLFDYNSFKPFDDTDFDSMELSEVLSYNKSSYEVNKTTNFPMLTYRESTDNLTDSQKEIRTSFLNEVKSYIMENGAAYVTTYMDEECVYNDASLNNYVIDVYKCPKYGGHAMQIIGWDDDVEFSYCADDYEHSNNTNNCNEVVEGKGVWILKNSWGNIVPNPYLTYDSGYTAISFIEDMQSKDNKNWDNNYVIDGDNVTSSLTLSLNQTAIKGNEKIKKVKFIAMDSNTTYNVKIQKSDGTYKNFSKTSYLPGLMTVDINEDLIVNKNSTITITGTNEFVDKISIFTSNTDTSPSIDLSEYDNKTMAFGSSRFYSETKNVPSGSSITYKLYNSSNNDFSNKMTVTNNIVAENNINTSISFANDLVGTFNLKAIYNSKVIGTATIKFTTLNGNGTESSPYQITNANEFYQIRNDLDSYYILKNDIDLTELTREGGTYNSPSNTCPQGFGWAAINNFGGSLDGNGHTIKGLYQNNYIECAEHSEWSDNGNGLFGTLRKNATIKNLILEDFDITCQGGVCGLLASKYIANANDSGGIDASDTTEYNAEFKNIAIKNSKMNGIYNYYTSGVSNVTGGGMFGSILSANGNVSISNIYIDIDLSIKSITDSGFLAGTIQGKSVNINNIRLLGKLTGKNDDNSGYAVLINNITGDTPVTIKNVVSTLEASKVMGSLLGSNYNDNLVINGANILSVGDRPVCYNNSCPNVSNLNVFNKDTQIAEFTKQSNYNSWQNLSTNWSLNTVNYIARIPVLKFMNFDYTDIPNISLKQELNKSKNIYDYITPKTRAAKMITFKSNNENVVRLESDGTLVPVSSGSTAIHVESLYDGYIKNVFISVTYVPHYNINFNANGGTGTMDSVEVSTTGTYTLPRNEFTREKYEFKEWNTKADGTGTSYSDLGKVNPYNDKQNVTLYAIWQGEEKIVTFNPDGGTVEPERKVVRYGEKYGDLPVPVKNGYGFSGWLSEDRTIYIDSDSILDSYENLIASWNENSYTIVYNANGGKLINNYNGNSTNVMSNTVVTAYSQNDTNYTLAELMFSRNKYNFKEWNTKSDGTGTTYSNEEIINTSGVENSILNLYAIWEENFDYSINTYTVDETNDYISKISVNTDVDTFTSNIELADGYTVEVDTKTINNKPVLYTGGKTKILKNNDPYVEFTNVVMGDISGDGAINSADLLKVRQHLLGNITLSGVYFLSSDINYDNSINSADLLRVRQHLLGTKLIG